jgi:hypothetical protein
MGFAGLMVDTVCSQGFAVVCSVPDSIRLRKNTEVGRPEGMVSLLRRSGGLPLDPVDN